MKCPMYMNSTWNMGLLQQIGFEDCIKEECAWWNDRFGMCSQAVDAYLQGQEDRHREMEMIRKGG